MKTFFAALLMLVAFQAAAEPLGGGYGPDGEVVLIFLGMAFAGYLGSKIFSYIQPGLSYDGFSRPIMGMIGGLAGMFLAVGFIAATGLNILSSFGTLIFGLGVAAIFAVGGGYVFAATLGVMKRNAKGMKKPSEDQITEN